MADDTIREMDRVITDWRLVTADSVMSIDEAYEYCGMKRSPKLLRMLRALWKVKNA